VINIINNKYNFTDILPRREYGNVDCKEFRKFMKTCMQDFSQNFSKHEFITVYNSWLVNLK
jgi:hypothetical protein